MKHAFILLTAVLAFSCSEQSLIIHEGDQSCEGDAIGCAGDWRWVCASGERILTEDCNERSLVCADGECVEPGASDGDILPDGDTISDGDVTPDGDVIPDGDVAPDGDVIPDGDVPPGGEPDFSLTPDPLDFPRAPTGVRVIETLGVKNVGSAGGQVVLQISSGSNPAFSISGMASATLAVGQSRDVDIACSANASDTPDDTLTGEICALWQDSEGTEQSRCVDLTATVVIAEPPCLAVTPLEGLYTPSGLQRDSWPGLDFGQVLTGHDYTRQFEVCNCGERTLTLDNVAIGSNCAEAEAANHFFITNNFGNNPQLEKGACRTMDVTFQASTGIPDQVYTRCIDFDTNAQALDWTSDNAWPADMTEGEMSLGLRAEATSIDLRFTPEALDLSPATAGCCTEVSTLNVTAAGSPVTIEDIRITSGATYFVLADPPSLPLALGDGHPNGTHIGVKLCPPVDSAIERQGTLEISFAELDQPVTIPLSGAIQSGLRQTDIYHEDAPKLDVLWVVDGSGSMIDDRARLADSIDTFMLKVADWQADVQLGIITCDMEDATQSGRLQGSPPVMRNSGTDAMTVSQIANAFKSRVNGTESYSDELGLEATYAALSEPLISGHNSGFLREHAMLGIVWLSDEDDQSPADTEFYIDFLHNLKRWIERFDLQAFAVVGDLPEGCSGEGGEASQGPRYIEVADACNPDDDAHFMSICTPDYDDIYASIGDHLMGPKDRFALSRPAVAESIQVTVEHVAVQNWTYEAESNSIVFNSDAIPARGDLIEIVYTVACPDER